MRSVRIDRENFRASDLVWRRRLVSRKLRYPLTETDVYGKYENNL